MKNRSIIRLLLATPLLTLAAIWAHELLPKRTYSPFDREESITYLFSDNHSGGNSTATWLNEKALTWQCQLAQGAAYPYCGISVMPGDEKTGMDLDNYNQVNLWVTYKGPAKKIRFFIRNYDNNFAPNDEGKFMSVQLNISDLTKQITLNKSELSVADWWVDDHEVPRHLGHPAFDNVVNIGLDFAHPLPFGSHNVAVNKIEFVAELISKEKWYLGIISIWVGGLFVFALTRWAQLTRRSQKAARRLAELTKANDELRISKEQYQQLSKTDPITGTLNRYGFTLAIEKVLQKRTPDLAVSLVIFSVDGYSRAKDRLGIKETDDFLKKISKLIDENIRDYHILGRWEGDEFVLLCPDTLASSAYLMAENIRRALNETGTLASPTNKLSISVGVAEVEQGYNSAEAFKKADEALYKAKSIGGNCTILA
ncbi:diguanylate cyclase (GGDEF) domain-containing protein [Alteromonadaceae bacterium Bs31]|nr:diguanylate cyclase (GGDEF) domain-containing protein [Alteromonadaceae bacterium Bs31]